MRTNPCASSTTPRAVNWSLVEQIRANFPRPVSESAPDGAALLMAIYAVLPVRDRALLEHVALLMAERQAGQP